MGTIEFAAVVAAVTLILGFSAADFSIPFLSPLIGEGACKTNVCGKGRCLTSSSSSVGFECVCEEGWKQARAEGDQFFKFLPCIIPNCTLNFDCAKSPAPAPKQNKSESSVFDPCYWTDCGGGSCNKTSVFTHSCMCEEGYYNLFNSTSFPCYKECAIRGDCGNLGMSVLNSSNSSPPQSTSPPRSTSVVGDSSSYAPRLIVGVEFSWLIVVVSTLAQYI